MSKKIIFLILFAVLLYFVNDYMNGCNYQTDIKLDGKVVVVTGANTGIGKETVIDLVQRGAKVYMGCRSMQRGQEALEDIRKLTGAPADKIVLLELDLGSLKSIRSFVQEFKKRENQLDILINNAGVMWVPYSKTEDGFETTFGTNHLGHFLLTNLLVDVLIKSAPSRIITISSKASYRGSMNFTDLMGEQDYNRVSAYSHSKLANILFAKHLARKLKSHGVSSFSLHPGAIITELGRHAPIVNLPIIRNVASALISPILKDVWHGARTTIYTALEPGIEIHTGQYFSDCAVKEPIPEANDEEIATKLWDVSADLVKLKAEEIHPAFRA